LAKDRYGGSFDAAHSDEQHIKRLAQQADILIQMPLKQDFDPIPIWQHAMRYSLDGTVNRYAMNTVMRHVWQGGAEGLDALCPERLACLPEVLFAPVVPWPESPRSAEHWLRSNTQMADAAGVYGFPACTVDNSVLVGLEGLDHLRAYVDDDGSDEQTT
jgi:hypothetical protein